jgi:Tfp pilus assembly protein PilO
MSMNRSLTMAVLCALAVSAAVGWFVIRPNYREMFALQGRIAELDTKIAGLEENTRAVEQLAGEVEQAQRRMESELKVIPVAPDVADLIRKLSLPVDGVNVVDQTFTAGTSNELDLGEAGTVTCMPLSVDMAATFDSVFALMRASESMSRLLRVSSVKVVCKREAKEDRADGVPVLEASLGLQAIYAPATSPGGEGDLADGEEG